MKSFTSFLHKVPRVLLFLEYTILYRNKKSLKPAYNMLSIYSHFKQHLSIACIKND